MRTCYLQAGVPGNAVHELAQAMELDHPEVRRRCHEFLALRTAGEESVKLNDIYPSKPGDPKMYEDHETTFPDQWIKKGGSAYSGKEPSHDDAATEILTTGLERLFEDPAGFARDDPQFFNFIIQTIQPRLRP